MDRIEAMTAFVAVADRGGFAPAARALGVAPSTVTRLVAALEERLGVRLFDRSTRAVRLTDPGSRFIDRARRILADLDEAERLAENARAAPSGRLALTAPVMFGKLHVAPLLGVYMARHPAVTVELGLNDRNVGLIEEGVDLAVRIGPLPDASLVVRKVGATRRVVVGSAAYLERMGVPASAADLARHRMIVCTGLGPADGLRFGAGREIPVSPVFVTNSVEAAIGHAAADGGLVQALGYQVADLLRSGRMRVALADLEPPPLPIQFVHPGARLLPVKVRALIDLAVETCDWSFLDLGPA